MLKFPTGETRMSSRPNSLRINQEERRFLGVCAGIADYLDLPVVLVRIIFVISMLTWPALIIAYFALYFWLDRDLSADKVYNWLSGSAPTQHLRNLDYRRPLYRNMRNRKIAGVCSGIADYLEVKPVLVRAVAILAAFVMGPYALLAYGVCWFVMEPNPAPRYNRHASRRQRRQARHRDRRQRREARHGLSSSRINTPEDADRDDMTEQEDFDSAGGYQARYEDAGQPTSTESAPDAMADSPAFSRRTGLSGSRVSSNEKSLEECTDSYLSLENRLRGLEAFITSKKFRLHCEINRI